jgi:hypothetical protein
MSVMFYRISDVLRRPAAAWFFFAIASVIFIVHVVEKGVGRMTGDSPAYLHTALVYEAQGEFSFPPYREPGYRAFVWAVSRVLPWTDDKSLARRVTTVQALIYGALAFLIAGITARHVGVWPAIGVMTIFAMDHYNISWITNVMSEALAKLIALAALAMILVGVWRRRAGWAAVGIALCGAIPLIRSTDIAVVLAVAAGVVVWALAARRFRPVIAAAGLLVPLFGIVAGYGYWYGSQTGFYGVSERGPAHAASRFLTLADPDRLLAGGMDPVVVENIARPLFENHRSGAGRTDIIIPAGSAYFPTPRGEYLDLAAHHLRALKGPNIDEREPAILAMTLSRQALLSDPAPIVWSVARITWDYIKNPLTTNVYGEGSGIQNWVFFVGWFVAAGIFLRRAGVRGPVAWGFFTAAITLMPAYWVGVSVGSFYGPRLATHMHLLTTLLFWLSLYQPETPEIGFSGIAR